MSSGIGICAMRPEPIETTIARLGKSGYDGIEISGEPALYDADDVKRLMELSADAISLETPIGSADGAATIGDVVEDASELAPEEIVAERLLSEDIDVVLDQLGDRERRVIELRYGLTGDEPLTLVEIGKFIGVTRERVRQIEIAAIEKLRRGGETARLQAH